MADFGRIIAGFVGGASNTALDLLKEKRDDRREIEKAKLLAQLRLQTDKDLADYQDKIADANVDKDMTTIEDGNVVIRDRQGREVSRRAQTASELESESFTRSERGLKLDTARKGLEKADADIGLAGAQAAYYRSGGSRSGSGTSLDGVDPADVAGLVRDEILYKAKDSISAARKAGVDDSDINVVVDRIIQREKVKGKPNLSSAARQVGDALSLISQGMQPVGKSGDTEFDRSVYDTAKNRFRTQRGLDNL